MELCNKLEQDVMKFLEETNGNKEIIFSQLAAHFLSRAKSFSNQVTIFFNYLLLLNWKCPIAINYI